VQSKSVCYSNIVLAGQVLLLAGGSTLSLTMWVVLLLLISVGGIAPGAQEAIPGKVSCHNKLCHFCLRACPCNPGVTLYRQMFGSVLALLIDFSPVLA
jgi:hypothetical protein